MPLERKEVKYERTIKNNFIQTINESRVTFKNEKL